MQKNYESRLLIICISVLFFVFSCLLSIPPRILKRLKKKGSPFYRRFLCSERPSMAVNFRDYCRSSCDVKSFLGTYFGVIEGATEVVKTHYSRLV